MTAMPLKKLSLRITTAHQGMRLDQALALLLPDALGQPLSKAKVRKLIVAGAVYLNGTRVRIASKELRANAKVDAYVDLKKLLEREGPAADRTFRMDAARVLFEDEDLIAVDKPAGLPTQPTLDEARDNLFASVKKFLAERDGTADPYLGLHHRLDRDTSGVVLFTKTKRANAGVADLFSGHQARKVYHALTVRPKKVNREWTVRNFLGRVEGKGGKKARFAAVRSGGDSAHTEFRLIEELDAALYVEARPRTGRTHQIRVHLASDGMPILGDAHYGWESGQDPTAPRMMLHAVSLTFQHPIQQTETSVQSPLPGDFLSCLQKLRS